MKIVLIGTVHSTRAALEQMLQDGLPIVGVCTLHSQYAKKVSDFVQLDDLCEAGHIPLLKFKNVNEEAVIHQIIEWAPDYLFVIGISQMITQRLLDVPRLGSIGAHPALLPEGRGRASLPWTILQGASETGMTLFFLDAGVDSGDIISQRRISVSSTETASTLYEKMAASIREQLHDIAPAIQAGTVTGRPQDESLATYTARRAEEDGVIDWERPGASIERLVRAVTLPYPGAYTFYKMEKLTVWSASLASDSPIIGVPGRIVGIDGEGLHVMTGDGVLTIKECSWKGERLRRFNEHFKVGEKLGLQLEEVLYHFEKKTARFEQFITERNLTHEYFSYSRTSG